MWIFIVEEGNLSSGLCGMKWFWCVGVAYVFISNRIIFFVWDADDLLFKERVSIWWGVILIMLSCFDTNRFVIFTIHLWLTENAQSNTVGLQAWTFAQDFYVRWIYDFFSSHFLGIEIKIRIRSTTFCFEGEMILFLWNRIFLMETWKELWPEKNTFENIW